MEYTSTTYRNIAVLMWGLVSFVGGVTVGSMFGMTGKELIFPIILLVGVYGLVLVKLFTRKMNKSDGVGGSRAYSAKDVSGSVNDLVSNDSVLTQTQARSWLDKFLVKQQQK